MEESILNIENLSVSFRDETGWRNAVEKVSFSLGRGKSIGIVGESGSGKSVTSLSIMRLLPKGNSRFDSGKITFTGADGKVSDILTLSEKDMRKLRGNRMAMIFQEPMTSLNPVMRCGRQVTEAIQLHLGHNAGKSRQLALELFTEVLLPNPERVFKAYPHQLSGGQKQRVMIAMAIACNPSLLIADEPTTALDVTVQKAILLLLKSLQAKYGMSLIFISHDLGVIAEIADEVVVMNQGAVVEQGKVADIFNNPQHPYTQGLIACRPPLGVRLKRLPTVADFTGKAFLEPALTKELFKYIDNADRALAHRELYGQSPLLKVKELSVYYPQPRKIFAKEKEAFKAVDKVSFDVFKGETLGLVGESGCGKTTLGRAILQLIKPTAGELFFEGIDLQKLNQRELRQMRQRMQIIFQDPYSSLNPRITAGQSIMEPMQAHNLYGNNAARKKQVLDLLDRVNLNPDHFNRYPHQFSGGQRQRICIARALALRPEFIICDESVSALDVSVQAQVLNLLNDLKRDFEFTYIFISHDLSVVRFMSDRMMVMKSGKIIESGEADALYENPSESYTKDLIAAIPGAKLTTVL